MYNQNNDNKPHGAGAGAPPRISFSNDFLESTNSHHNLNLHHQQMMRMAYRDAPVSSDFEFSVSNNNIISAADQLFSQGKLLPYKETCGNNNQMQKGSSSSTLRDELLVQDNDEEDGNFHFKPPKTSTRWRGLLGFKKSNLGSKKLHKGQSSASAAFQDVHANNNSQDPNSRDFEFRF